MLVLSMAAATFLSHQQVQPLNKVAEAARRFGRGELDTRVEVPNSCGEEIVDLASAFNTMADSLEKSEQRRQEFVANVTHELKTPMTTIGGYIDGMLDGTIPPEKQQPLHADRLRTRCAGSRGSCATCSISQSLQAMGVEDSRKTRFDLGEELSDVLITFEQKIYNKHLDVRVDLPDKPVWTRAERDSITQVIYNLIDNAIKFCPDGGRLSLRVQSDGGKARVSVENTGPTIDKDELPLLFDRFHKADKSRSADREGWGLGSYIAKTIVGAHGGDIWATSENGVTQFNFTLPAVR
ncbi:MAG: ATP-binding protein [Oscillospiraceae bacterium]